MKATIKINKLGTAFFGLQTTMDDVNVWGRYADTKDRTAEEQDNIVKSIFTVNSDADFEIEYTKAEGKKGFMIQSIHEIKDGKIIPITKEQTKTVKLVKKEKSVATPEAKDVNNNTTINNSSTTVKSKPSYKPNDTQVSIENQTSAKIAGEVVGSTLQMFAGHLDPKKDIDLVILIINKVFNSTFDNANIKIRG